VLAEAALELVWPTRCAGCEKPGQVLCTACAATLNFTTQKYACPDCGAPFGFLVCTECYSRSGKERHAFSTAVCTVSLDELSGRIIVLYKDNNERRLAGNLAELLLEALPQSWLSWADVLTWIPTDKKAQRRRGFDHMERIAQEVAQLTQMQARGLLSKKPCRDQRRLNREERINNLKESFSLVAEAELVPQNVLLIDDVFTTGSTLNAATLTLIEGGAQEVRVASIARAW